MLFVSACWLLKSLQRHTYTTARQKLESQLAGLTQHLYILKACHQCVPLHIAVTGNLLSADDLYKKLFLHIRNDIKWSTNTDDDWLDWPILKSSIITANLQNVLQAWTAASIGKTNTKVQLFHIDRSQYLQKNLLLCISVWFIGTVASKWEVCLAM